MEKMSNPTGSFQRIVNDADSIFASKSVSNNGAISSEEKAFRRWEYFNRTRSTYPGVQNGGSIGGVEEYLQGHSNLHNCTSNVNTVPWSFIGQNPTVLDNQTIGIVISVAVHPTNQNIIYLGSSDASVYAYSSQSFLPNEVHCPNTTAMTQEEGKQQLSLLKTEKEVLIARNVSLIDGGNKQNLLNSINSQMSEGQLKNLLVSKSPYLSDDVLISYLTKPQSPPSGHIEQVVIANSPVTITVKSVIDNLILPQGIRNTINNAQTGVSARFNIEGELTINENNIQSLVSNQIAYHLNDTLNPHALDSVIYLMKTENRPHAECEIIQVHINKGELQTASLLLDTLELNPEMYEFCRFHRLLIELNQANEKCYSMKTDLILKEKIELIANDESKEAMCHAQALLREVFDYEYPKLKLLPRTSRGMTQNSGNEYINPNENKNVLKNEI